MATTETAPFLTAFNGSFVGILRWPQLDEFWNVLRADAGGGWYVYAIGEPPPNAPSSAADVTRFVDEIGPLLRREYPEDHCGIVYVDDVTHPAFVKIYDPHNLGVVCGYSDNPPLPGWIMSKLAPVDLPAQQLTAQRKRWWVRVFGGK
jgi:hypothetical protein